MYNHHIHSRARYSLQAKTYLAMRSCYNLVCPMKKLSRHTTWIQRNSHQQNSADLALEQHVKHAEPLLQVQDSMARRYLGKYRRLSPNVCMKRHALKVAFPVPPVVCLPACLVASTRKVMRSNQRPKTTLSKRYKARSNPICRTYSMI